MTLPRAPKIPIPKPMLGLEPDSWAYRAITVRFAGYIDQILGDNQFPEEIVAQLLALKADIPQAPIRPINDPAAPDEEAWNRYIASYEGMNWLEPPWFFSEHYFYRRIMEAIGYFQAGIYAEFDPFLRSKQSGLEHGIASIIEMASQLAGWLASGFTQREIILSLLHMDLWGNQADYSLWPADADGEYKPDHGASAQTDDFLLVDDSSQIVDYFLAKGNENSRVDFMIDNAGLELVSDLVLTDYLLSSGLAAQVRFHLKAHPTFVSDALPKDVEETIAFFQSAENTPIVALGDRLFMHLHENRLLLCSDFFWNSPLDGWDLPEHLASEISKSDLVICKGDANYRRLLGDRHWPFTTPFADIVAYFPTPLVALRTLKSELACGLTTDQVETLFAKDPDWLVNGRWGIIQFLNE